MRCFWFVFFVQFFHSQHHLQQKTQPNQGISCLENDSLVNCLCDSTNNSSKRARRKSKNGVRIFIFWRNIFLIQIDVLSVRESNSFHGGSKSNFALTKQHVERSKMGKAINLPIEKNKRIAARLFFFRGKTPKPAC